MSIAAHVHDAGKALSDLRDHLARHDKPLAFLFGAGTSCAVRVNAAEAGQTKPLIPAVAELTKIVKADACALGQKFNKAWELIEQDLESQKTSVNVETVLSRLRMMLGAIGEKDCLVGLTRSEIEQVEQTVRTTIVREVSPVLDQLPADIPHRKFARWLARSSRQQPVEVFTVNYDVLFEHALEAERVPVFDGFVGCYQPFFHPDSLRRPEAAPASRWTRIWKMHGSITWRRIDSNGTLRVVRGAPHDAGEMIYPSLQKYDESRQQPYSALTDRLQRFLEQDDALLIVAGFNFGDEHINSILFSVLENRPRTHLYCLQFEEVGIELELARRAESRANLIVVGPETGILGSRRAPWSAQQPVPSVGDAFSLRTRGDSENKPIGEMKIGEFGVFCEFLHSMTTD